ncbi:uracil-DNA glycosylase family protein [Halalkalicoccus sp. NIPERK01]|uniref:uracil-DNA glycosylase n=1 Tax=Halalkalicoccus sp. NIPERK01 TaxID=3053469 RepID=UPI0034E93720
MAAESLGSTVPEYPETRNVLEPNCTRCPHLAESRECISWGTGPLDSSVIVVGEAPGAGTPEADRWKGGNWTGMAYTARHSGRVIRDLMESVGYHDAYYTNAVKCFPPDVPASEASGSSSEPDSDGGEGSNREPTDEELTNCRTHLVTEVEQIQPSAIVPTGKHATETLLALDDRSLEGFTDHVLTPIDCEALATPLLPVLHPSYQNIWIARLGYEPEEYREELKRELDALCAGG